MFLFFCFFFRFLFICFSFECLWLFKKGEMNFLADAGTMRPFSDIRVSASTRSGGRKSLCKYRKQASRSYYIKFYGLRVRTALSLGILHSYIVRDFFCLGDSFSFRPDKRSRYCIITSRFFSLFRGRYRTRNGIIPWSVIKT